MNRTDDDIEEEMNGIMSEDISKSEIKDETLEAIILVLFCYNCIGETF